MSAPSSGSWPRRCARPRPAVNRCGQRWRSWACRATSRLLRELAASVELAAESGTRIRETLIAKAGAMRIRQLTEVEGGGPEGVRDDGRRPGPDRRGRRRAHRLPRTRTVLRGRTMSALVPDLSSVTESRTQPPDVGPNGARRPTTRRSDSMQLIPIRILTAWLAAQDRLHRRRPTGPGRAGRIDRQRHPPGGARSCGGRGGSDHRRQAEQRRQLGTRRLSGDDGVLATRDHPAGGAAGLLARAPGRDGAARTAPGPGGGAGRRGRRRGGWRRRRARHAI